MNIHINRNTTIEAVILNKLANIGLQRIRKLAPGMRIKLVNK